MNNNPKSDQIHTAYIINNSKRTNAISHMKANQIYKTFIQLFYL